MLANQISEGGGLGRVTRLCFGLDAMCPHDRSSVHGLRLATACGQFEVAGSIQELGRVRLLVWRCLTPISGCWLSQHCAWSGAAQSIGSQATADQTGDLGKRRRR